MVGVAGRSKGCATCRRRKKGCDLQRPMCGECIKTGSAACEYDPDRVFITSSYQAAQPGSSSSASPSTVHVRRGSSSSTSQVELPDTPTLTAYEDRYLSMFWNTWLPCATTGNNSRLAQFPIPSWISLSQNIYRQDAALRKTVLAVCLGTLGRRDGEAWMVNESLKLYVSALAEVGSRLRNPGRCPSDALVMASRGLAIFELQHGATPEANRPDVSQALSWHGHNLGEMALIEQRAPARHTTGLGHQIFVDGRADLWFASCMRRKRTFLSTEPWKTVPWTGRVKNSKDMLIDVLFDIPGILEDVDILRTQPPPGSSPPFEAIHQRLMEACLWVYHGLADWFATCFSSRDHACLNTAAIRGYQSPTADELAVAHAMSLFWTGCVLTYSTMHLGLAFGSSYPSEAAAACATLGPTADPGPYCSQLIDLIEVFMQPEAGGFGTTAAPFPASIVFTYLLSTEGEDSPELQRLVAYFDRPGRGMLMGRFLRSSIKEWPGPKLVPPP